MLFNTKWIYVLRNLNDYLFQYLGVKHFAENLWLCLQCLKLADYNYYFLSILIHWNFPALTIADLFQNQSIASSEDFSGVFNNSSILFATNGMKKIICKD